MKRTILMLFAFCTMLMSCSNNDQIEPEVVPQAVKSTMAHTFANATAVAWEKKGNNHQAAFLLDGVKHAALVAKDGTLLMHKHVMDAVELPTAVVATITEQYPGKLIEVTEQVRRQGTTYYQVELQDTGLSHQVVVLENGQLQNAKLYWD